MRIWAPRLREEVWAALPEGVEVRFLDEPWPKACDLFIPPYGQEEVVRRVLEEVEVKVVQTLSAGVDWILPLVPEGVVLCDGSGIHDAPVAEWVVLALLALLKDLSGFLEAQKEGRWAPRRLSDLEGKRVLVHRKPEGGGDIGVGADMRRAIRHTAPDQRPGPCGGIQGEGREQRLVSRNPAHAEGLRRMGSPGQAEQGLIQMHMPIHQGGQQQIPIQVQNLPCRGCWGIRRQDGGDPPILQRQRPSRRPAIGQAQIDQKGIVKRRGHFLPPSPGPKGLAAC